jgi:hypothetical protein
MNILINCSPNKRNGEIENENEKYVKKINADKY